MVREAAEKTAEELGKAVEKETKKLIKDTERAASNQPANQEEESRRALAETKSAVKSGIKIATAWGREIAAWEEIEY